MRVEAQNLDGKKRLSIWCNKEQFANFQYIWLALTEQTIPILDLFYVQKGIDNFVINTVSGIEIIFLDSEIEQYKDEVFSGEAPFKQ